MKNTLRSKKTFQISTYIPNGWEITKNCFRKTKRVLQMKQKLIIISKYFFLYYLVDEMFMLSNT